MCLSEHGYMYVSAGVYGGAGFPSTEIAGSCESKDVEGRTPVF